MLYRRFCANIVPPVCLVSLASCAIVSSGLSQEADVCRAADGRYVLSVSQIQTVRGSFHTPFDYSNKSVAVDRFLIRISSATARTWNAEDLEVVINGHFAQTRKGTLEVKSDQIDIDLAVAAPADVADPRGRVYGILRAVNAGAIAGAETCAVK